MMNDNETFISSKKATKLRNHLNKTETFDSLCTKNIEVRKKYSISFIFIK